MICSVLIPTRGRAAKLARAVESIRATSNAQNVEILLRGDNDDPDFRDTLSTLDNVTAIIGPRWDGYASLHTFYENLAAIAQGKWIMCFNDDAVLEGAGWDVELEFVPSEGFICHPHRHRLGASLYHTTDCSPFPIVRNGFWKMAGHDRIGGMVDMWMCAVARDLNMQTRLLNSLTIFHDRQQDNTLKEHL